MSSVVAPQRTLRSILTVFSGAGFIIDSDGYYLDIMQGSEEGGLLYDDPNHLRDQRVDEVIPDPMADRFLDTIQAVLDDHTTETIEYELDVKKGHCWFEATVTPLQPVEKPPDAVVWVARDVTDRKERQQQLEAQKTKIEALHDVAADIETCETADDVYDLLVEAAESVLEFDIAIADAAQGDVLVPRAVSSAASADQYYDETPIDAEDNLAAEAFRTGDASLVDDLRTHDVAPADPVFRSALTVPIGDHGVFQSVARDPDAFDERDLELVEILVSHAQARLTQIARRRKLREQTEQLQRQNERLDEFASIVSHDLRTPLSVAKGNLALARQEAETEYHEKVDDALDRMEQLIEDLLTLARQGERVGDLEPVALADLAKSCWGPIATEEATLVTTTDKQICADPGRLQQLLENLLTNAIEHGGDDATVTVGALDDGFYVADDGPGVPPEERDEIFESGYSTAPDGTGFGLTIVREIADAHGWTVTVTDSDAGGARFEITGVELPNDATP